ncbi:MAG: sugar transferase [Cyclobacteriaceae bacterium]
MSKAAQFKKSNSLFKEKIVDYPSINGRQDAITRRLFLGHPLTNITNRYAKRILDLCVALPVVILILSWSIPIVALLIMLDSSGNPFFVQKRHGRYRKEFPLFKFRTMKQNSESDTKQAQGLKDARITQLGMFLRKYSIDELPQFCNVLLGHMSVVGPRPHMIPQNIYFEQHIENYNYRMMVKPGITGMAQCMGKHGPTPNVLAMSQRVKFDIFYIRNWKFSLDIWILWKTLLMILGYSVNRAAHPDHQLHVE